MDTKRRGGRVALGGSLRSPPEAGKARFDVAHRRQGEQGKPFDVAPFGTQGKQGKHGGRAQRGPFDPSTMLRASRLRAGRVNGLRRVCFGLQV